MRSRVCWAALLAVSASAAGEAGAAETAPRARTIVEAFAPFAADPWRGCRRGGDDAEAEAARWRAAIGLGAPDAAPCPTPALIDAMFADLGPPRPAGRFDRFDDGAPSPQALVPLTAADIAGLDAPSLSAAEAVKAMLAAPQNPRSIGPEPAEPLSPQELAPTGDAESVLAVEGADVAAVADEAAGDAPEHTPLTAPTVELDPPAMAAPEPRLSRPVEARRPSRGVSARPAAAKPARKIVRRAPKPPALAATRQPIIRARLAQQPPSVQEVAPRPQARSFSPKMSSAGPPQTQPRTDAK